MNLIDMRSFSTHPMFSFMCMFCRSLFVLLYFFFWPLCCLFFFDLRILTTPLVSSNSSYTITRKNRSFSDYAFLCESQIKNCLDLDSDACVNFIKTISEVLYNDVILNLDNMRQVRFISICPMVLSFSHFRNQNGSYTMKTS
jgi:hypothetical protein